MPKAIQRTAHASLCLGAFARQSSVIPDLTARVGRWRQERPSAPVSVDHHGSHEEARIAHRCGDLIGADFGRPLRQLRLAPPCRSPRTPPPASPSFFRISLFHPSSSPSLSPPLFSTFFFSSFSSPLHSLVLRFFCSPSPPFLHLPLLLLFSFMFFLSFRNKW